MSVYTGNLNYPSLQLLSNAEHFRWFELKRFASHQSKVVDTFC